MPTEVYLVKVGMNMTEGVVEEWYIPDGGMVTKGELLYRLETEKVNLDVDAEASGTVRHLIAEGITKEPGDIVGYIYAPSEAIPESLTGVTAPATSPPPPAAVMEAQTELALTPRTARTATVTPEGRIKASPLARRLAAERNLDLGSLRGTGPDGRIVEADVLTADVTTTETEAASAPTGDDGSQRSSPMARKLARERGISLEGVNGTGPGGRITKEDVEALVDQHQQSATRGEDEIIPLRGMRRTIAERMHSSLRNTAQLTMDMDVRMDDAVKLRAQLIVEWAEKDIRPTYTDLVIRAAAKALTRHRHMNAELTEDALVLKQTVNVGMAVAVPDGLIVPVIAGADQMSLEEIARRSTRLSSLARDGGLTPDDLQGGTFTVTALGMFGVDAFTPIINAPQAGILGINRIRDDTAWEDGVPRQTKVMRLSLTWDHRVLDGAPAAEFLAEVRDLLEAPYRLLI